MSVVRDDRSNDAAFKDGMDLLLNAWALRFASSRLFFLALLIFWFSPVFSYAFTRSPADHSRPMIAIGIALAVLGASVMCGVASRRRLNRASADLKPLVLEFCTRCKAPLAGTDIEGECPKCRLPYHRREARGQWKERFRHIGKDRPEEWRHWSRLWDTSMIVTMVTAFLLAIVAVM